ncbi:MAG: hypothetical protein L6M37_01740 [Candidatus Methylarchaceae archaeon HK02M1]|nr:hypothetical protein [Candidatus Methylarchaceae archaeon HK02M1]
MRFRYKILVVALVAIAFTAIISVSLGYYLMSHYPLLEYSVDGNPFEALRVAGQMVVNDWSQKTPVKNFDSGQADFDYSQTVDFPEDKLELTTAEHIIEWCVNKKSQPWVKDVEEFLLEADFSLMDIVAHFIFIECKSGNNPVMTVTYYVASRSMLIEKGWIERDIYNSYTCYLTEDLALDVIRYDGDYKFILKIIMENLNRNIRIFSEQP